MRTKSQAASEHKKVASQRRPTFLLELPVQVNVGQAARVRAHLEAGRQFYNAVLSEGLKRLRAMRADPVWQVARAIPHAPSTASAWDRLAGCVFAAMVVASAASRIHATILGCASCCRNRKKGLIWKDDHLPALIEVSPRQAKLSQFCHGCGRHVKKPLSQRWHTCACGVGPVQRDLYSAFLACTLEQDHLLPSCAQAVILSRRCAGASAGRTRTGSATGERGAGLAQTALASPEPESVGLKV
jgi:hypothetical protein